MSHKAVLKVGVGLIGPGAIGGTFLKQLSLQKRKLVKQYGIDTEVVGIMGSRRMHVNPTGIDLADWRHVYENSSVDADVDVFFGQVRGCDRFTEHIMIDSSATEEVPDHYNGWLETGCHVVTPNKKYGSGSLQRYKKGQGLCADHGSQFLYEATVGAGLPVISTLQGLMDTGDVVHTIEGVLSGTLSYIFNQVSTEMSFSHVVSKAREMGYTEPDPRDDLAGTDVARKVIVLARECGIDVELEDLTVESLVPKELDSVADVETFMKELHKNDDGMLAKISEADSAGEVLRYVGRIDTQEKKCEVGLKRYPRSHPFSGLSGTDNMIIFKTERYNDQQLVIQGPGAGAEVTAMGVLSDFITIAKRLKN